MPEWMIMAAVLAIYIILMRWVLPKAGVGT